MLYMQSPDCKLFWMVYHGFALHQNHGEDPKLILILSQHRISGDTSTSEIFTLPKLPSGMIRNGGKLWLLFAKNLPSVLTDKQNKHVISLLVPTSNVYPQGTTVN